jgi:hypothetical protein
MAKTRKLLTVVSILAAVILLAGSGCKKDETTTPTPARTTTYTLKYIYEQGVSGTVTFTETTSTTTTILISLAGPLSGTYTAELCMYSAVEEGIVVQTLNAFDASWKSSTAVTTMAYSDLIAYDGCIVVHKLSQVIAKGDIGGNVITASNKTYTLTAVSPYTASGSALFEKRVNGNTLVTISLTNGAIAGDLYPATINLGSITTAGGGDVKKTLNDVIGNTGKSYTNIRTLNSGFPVTYDEWLVYDGYLNVYHTSVSLANIICHGNIGSN